MTIFKKGFVPVVVFCIAALLLPVRTAVADGGTVVVRNASGLASAVERANQGGPKTILVENGTYILDQGLWVEASGVSIKGKSGRRDDVRIFGQGMDGSVSHVIWAAGTGFRLENVTVGRVANHAVQVHGERNVDGVVIRNVRFVDTREQMLKVSYDENSHSGSDRGLVEGCLFEYSQGIGPQYYIGGIDAHNATGWVVRGNVFRGIRSPSEDVAEFAVHFWSDSKDTRVENNVIVNCDRGIGFGLGDRGHRGGIIRNNMIYHDSSEGFADVGIALETAPGANVYNNTIFMENSYPNAIEYRFPSTTTVVIANNLANKAVRSRDGATADLFANVTNARKDWFKNPAQGDLRLVRPIKSVVDQGRKIKGLTSDIDGTSRPMGGGVDIGAHEYR